MRSEPAVDSKKIDIACSKTITVQETTAMLSFCAEFKIRPLSGEGMKMLRS
jgi:D-arabinose 1-dehydrogenase-like Zn-dependent alcohol dehydrogenase